MQVQSIFIYPIKSLKGIELKEATVLEQGLHGDRFLMLVDETGQFITQRTHNDLCFFKQEINFKDNELTITYKENQLTVNWETDFGKLISISVWNDSFDALEATEKVNLWFSKQLNQNIKLVKMPQSLPRETSKNEHKVSSKVSFADGYPYLICSTSSLSNLQDKIDMDITIQRFRPNIYIQNTIPFEEDSWEKFHIGAATFTGIKACARCIVVNINPETGQSSNDTLATLATYRKQENKVFFGRNAQLASGANAVIKTGDLLSPA